MEVNKREKKKKKKGFYVLKILKPSLAVKTYKLERLKEEFRFDMLCWVWFCVLCFVSERPNMVIRGNKNEVREKENRED